MNIEKQTGKQIYINQKSAAGYNPLGFNGHKNFFKCDKEGDKAIQKTIELLKTFGFDEFIEHKITETENGLFKEYNKDLTAINNKKNITKTFEVKYDKVFTSKNAREKYNNLKLFIEVENFNKPSGLNITEADYWIQVTDLCIFFIPVVNLRNNMYNNNYIKYIYCGDKNASKCALIDFYILKKSNVYIYMNEKYDNLVLKNEDLEKNNKIIKKIFNLI